MCCMLEHAEQSQTETGSHGSPYLARNASIAATSYATMAQFIKLQCSREKRASIGTKRTMDVPILETSAVDVTASGSSVLIS